MPAEPNRRFVKSYDSGSINDIVACALRGDIDAVDDVLATDPSQINAQRVENGLTPLMAASGRGLEQMVGHLLSKPGIDTSLTDTAGKDALIYARPFPNIVKRIMQHRNPDLKWSEPSIHPV